MPKIGATQMITTTKRCDNGVIVDCKQLQTYERTVFLLYLGGRWVDTGAPTCDPCPKGQQSRTTALRICCFAGTRLLEPQSSTGPGAAGAILDKINQVTNGGVVKVLGPTPVVQGFRQLKQCQLVKGSEIKLWIAALQEALPVMKAMNFDTRDQDKAIACLTKLAKEFNWLGEAILVSPEVVKTPTPTTPTRPTAPSKPVTPERPSTPTVPVTKSPEKAKIGDATVVPRRN